LLEEMVALGLMQQIPPSPLVGPVHIPQKNATLSLLPFNSGSVKVITLKKMFLGFSCFGSSPTLQAAAN